MIESASPDLELTGAERYDRWRQAAFESHNPCEMHLDRPADFDASLRVLDLGAVRGTSFQCPPLFSARTPRLIRLSDPEVVYLATPRRGRVEVGRGDSRFVVEPGDLLLMSSSYPFQTGLRNESGAFALNDLLVPRALLPETLRPGSHSVSLHFPSPTGLAALLVQLLTHLVDDYAIYRPAHTHMLGTAAVDLVAAVLTHHLDRPLPPEERQRVLTLRVHDFVQRHLHEDDLTPATIAAAHHVSPRSLHRLFQQNGTTVGAFIREQRLQRARRALADPLSAHLTIAAIARHHGFARPADFTRAFRSAYGLPPRDYRERALRS
ncbi:helix-turn-helix domain-containing protein [Streptomyces profundus]|uniref:helix-turn-helix domain-containing protein n=1 Tax=Streptomyces profundus TaxID=2867410 RepID=UPI001D1677C1|nr:helix-turn-helix domain-containing protein [Streptomyces sp. MA3_2.13]UED83389.1 helix-turn-helix domain-containing protein [Streptomyces sp. MA3_2.13]